MGALDKALPKVAKKVIGKLGKTDVTYRAITEGAYDTATGKVGQTTTDTTFTASVGEYSVKELNNLIRRDDVKLEVAANELSAKSITLNRKDRIVIDSIAHEIIAFHPIYSGNLIAMYVVQARRT